MARVRELSGADDELKNDLSRSFQSGHINFLLGAGASYPAYSLRWTSRTGDQRSSTGWGRRNRWPPSLWNCSPPCRDRPIACCSTRRSLVHSVRAGAQTFSSRAHPGLQLAQPSGPCVGIR